MGHEVPIVLLLAMCLLFASRMRVDADIRFEPLNGSVRRGANYTFTLRVNQSDVIKTGLVSFRRGDPPARLCGLNITTGKTFLIPEHGYQCREGEDKRSYFLDIRNVSKSDSDIWYAQYGGNLSNKVTLDVKYPPTVKIQRVAPCTEFTYAVNDTRVSLNCTVISGNPAPTSFRWYHNNSTVNITNQIFRIPTVKRSSKGLYRCEADNGEAPKGMDTVTVNVHYPPQVTVEKYYLVNESRDLNIPCTADANPNVTSLVWTKKGATDIFSETKGVLHLKNLTKTDNGTYICTAQNTLTTCLGVRNETGRAEVKVEIQYKPKITSFRIQRKAGPEDKTVTVPEHENVTFECKEDSFPRANVSFEKEGESVKLKRDGLSAKCEDRGNYTCSAKNLLGEDKSDTKQLLVNCKPRQVEESSRIVTATIGGNATFQLEVIAYPKPHFTLTKSDTQNPVGSDRDPTFDGLKARGTITLHNIRPNHLGNYTLRVNNTEGKLDIGIELRTKSKPNQPGNLQVHNVDTRSLSLSWEKGFDGGAVQNFTVEYRQNGGQWIKHPDTLSEDDLHLDLDGLEPSSDYEIRVKAKNKYGSSDYIYINAKTKSDVPFGLYGGVAAVVIVIIIIIVVVVVFKKRTGSRDKRSARDPAEDDDELVMEDNMMYASYPNPTTSGERGDNSGDVYAVVQKPKKTNEVSDDVYSQPQKKEKKKKKKKKKEQIETDDVYANTGANAEETKDEVYANTGANAEETKAVPKTGRDEDGLLYMSVDFGNQPTSGVIIGADMSTEQYSAIDFRSLGGAQNKEDN